MNTASSEEVNLGQKCASETVADSTGTHYSNENPSPADSVELPHSAVILLLHNERSHSVEANFCKVPQPITTLLPEKETTHAAESEGPRSSTTQGNAVEKLSIDLAIPKSADHVHQVVPEINDWEKTSEAVDVKRVITNITSSAEVNQCQKCMCETVIDSTGVCTSSGDPSSANSNNHEGQYIFPRVLLDKELTDTAESETFEGLSSMASPLLSHSTKSHFLEGHDRVSGSLPENDAIETAENVATVISQCTASLQVEKGTLDSAENSLGMPSPPVEKDMLHCGENDFLQGTYSIPSLLLDKETGDTSETTPLEVSFCLVSPKIEKVPLKSIDETVKLRKRSSLSNRCDNESSRILEQSSGCHVLPAPINESALQPYLLADNVSEAHDACAWKNIDISARPEALSAASCKSARALQSLERNCRMTTEKLNSLPHHGTEQKICCFDNTMEINADSCVAVSDNQTKSPRTSAQLLCSSGSAKNFSSLRPELPDDQGMFSTLLDTDAGHTSKTSSFKGLYFSVSPQHENDLWQTVEHAEQLGNRTSLSSRSINGSPKILEQKITRCHMPRAPFSESFLQQDQLHDTTSEAPEMLGTPQVNMLEEPCEHSCGCSSVSSEKFSSLESHVQITASHLDKLSASGIKVNWNSSCENVEMKEQSDDELYGSSSTMSTSSSPDNQDDIHDQIKTRGNFSGKELPSLSYLSRSASSEGRGNASNRTSPLIHGVPAAVDYSTERSMSSLTDAIRCSSPILQASLCSVSSLNTKVTTISQHSQSYSLANNLDAAFASVASFSDFQADGGRCYIRQEGCTSIY